ncbi:MAG: preprotein translocase subunit SecG [Actinomycetes bacterium]
MSVVEVVLVGLLMLTSGLIVAFILMHKGKGGGLSDMFGGGFTSSYGGSSVAERNLDRITIALIVIWFADIVAIGLMNAS